MRLTKVLFVGNHDPLAHLLQEMLLREPGLELIGEAGSVHTGLAMLVEAKPDAVIMDLNPPDMCGLEAIPLILERTPLAKVILLTDQDDQRYQQAAVMKGAYACVRKDLIATELMPAVKRTLEVDAPEAK